MHCYGHPCDVAKIEAIADAYGLKVIYDAFHAFGVKTFGQRTECRGFIGTSFHATKVFNTFEGGAVVCHDAKTKQRIDRLKNFGFVDETSVAALALTEK